MKPTFYLILQYTILSTLFVLSFTTTKVAEAPAENPSSYIVTRNLAKIQEERVDKKLRKLKKCYGVELEYKGAYQSRRRTCKVLLVHRLESVLASPGTYFSEPILFQCRNNSSGFTRSYTYKNKPVFKLKPNQEYRSIDMAIQDYLSRGNDPHRWMEARRACTFYLDCLSMMKFSKLSYKNIKHCASHVGSMVGTVIQWKLLRTIFEKRSHWLLMAYLLREN